MSANGAGGHRRRRGARFRQRPVPVPVTPAPRAAPARSSRLTLFAVLLGGVLLGAFAQALLPVGARRVFELGVAAGFALVAALAYRRWVRGLIEERRRRERSG